MMKYLITFTDASERSIGEIVTTQECYEDACRYGWANAPEGTDDFQVISEDAYITLVGAPLSEAA